MKIPNCPICKNPPCLSFKETKDGPSGDFSYSCVGPVVITAQGVDRSKEHSPLNTACQPTREAARQNWIQIVRDVKRRQEVQP